MTTISHTAMERLGWRRVDERPWRKGSARWLHRSGWTLEHCGHPTALWPWLLKDPDGLVFLAGVRVGNPPDFGTAWPNLREPAEWLQMHQHEAASPARGRVMKEHALAGHSGPFLLEPHEFAGLLPMLPEDELAALAESIEAGGLRHPITLFEGKILDGRNRYRACEIAGVKPLFVQFPGTPLDALQLVVDENLHRRHLSSEQAAAFWELRKRAEAKIAEAVESVRAQAKERQRTHGGTAPGRKATPVEKVPQVKSRAVEAKLAGTNTVYLAQAKKLDDEQLKRVVAGERGLTQAHVSQNSGSVEWYTPAPLIDLARQVLGGIDLDPASSELANETVRAARFFTADDDGLVKRWSGRVWMNPPYSAGLVDAFADKMIASITDGDVASAIVLVNNATDTRWFQSLARIFDAVCLIAGRVRFLRPDGSTGVPLQGQALLYFGDDAKTFREVMEPHGVTYAR